MTDNEREIMNVLWDVKMPLTSKEIMERLNQKRWNTPKLFRLLNSMQEENLIEISGYIPGNKHYTRQFRPCISKNEHYFRMMSEDGVDVKSVLNIAAALMGNSVDKDKTKKGLLVEELEDIIARIEEEEEED